jgi:hypothetical protein
VTDAKAAIDALTTAFFEAFSSPDRVPLIAQLFIPQGMIIKNLGAQPVVYSVPEFIAPRLELLASCRLTDFSEAETAERTQIWGNVAQRWSSYRKSGILDGQPFTGGGCKSSQFVNTPEGWRLCSLIWDDEQAAPSMG